MKMLMDLPTSDLLGDLKDEYGDLLLLNPMCYISELIVFGPKMYQLILCDKNSGEVVKWSKTMKGISLKGNLDIFSNDKIPLYRNPVLEFLLCSTIWIKDEIYVHARDMGRYAVIKEKANW